MKKIIFCYILNQLIFYCKCYWSSKFIKINKQISDQSWQIYKIQTQISKFKCLNKCREFFYCSYVFHDEQNCILYSEYAKNSLIDSIDGHLVYMKLYNQINLKECHSSNEYWSIGQRKCLNCPPNFTKYSSWPFACFYKPSGKFTFESAKSECQSLGGELISPQNSDKIYFITQQFGKDHILVDSRRSDLNETIKWKDGSKVGGFSPGEPTNTAKNSNQLVEPVVSMSNYKFYDVSLTNNYNIVCETID